MLMSSCSYWPDCQASLPPACSNLSLLDLLVTRTDHLTEVESQNYAFSIRNSYILPSFLTCFKHFAADWNVFGFSQWMNFGLSSRAINLLKHFMKFLGVKFSASSKCTALLTPQVSRRIYAFDSLLNLGQ